MNEVHSLCFNAVYVSAGGRTLMTSRNFVHPITRLLSINFILQLSQNPRPLSLMILTSFKKCPWPRTKSGLFFYFSLIAELSTNKVKLTFGSSRPSRLWNSFLGIMNAAKLAVYKARKTTANRAQIADINLKIKAKCHH